MDARRRSVNKNDSKTPYNHTSESHVIEHVPHTHQGAMVQLSLDI